MSLTQVPKDISNARSLTSFKFHVPIPTVRGACLCLSSHGNSKVLSRIYLAPRKGFSVWKNEVIGCIRQIRLLSKYGLKSKVHRITRLQTEVATSLYKASIASCADGHPNRFIQNYQNEKFYKVRNNVKLSP
jgi:hypothetical protein